MSYELRVTVGPKDNQPIQNSKFITQNSFHRFLACAVLAVVLGLVPTQGQAQNAPVVTRFQLGLSAQGRAIEGVQVGAGPHKVVVIGNTHGGPEANTFELVKQLVTHFEAAPEDVPPDVRLLLVPTVNPDGLALDVRQNASGIDLNRNMDTSFDRCDDNDWRTVTEGAYGVVGPIGGPYAESEVESRLVRDFLLDADAVIFVHSNAGVVFPACDHPPSITLARIYADAANYLFTPRWDKYPITGGMHDWAGGLGIAAITPELVSGDEPEFEQNLRGLRAVLQAGPEIVPTPTPAVEAGVPVQPVIWRAWRAWGGRTLFGSPLEPATRTGDGWSQLFERARFEYRPALSQSTNVVQLALLGHDSLRTGAEGVERVPPPDDPTVRYFPASGHTLRPPFADYWQINGALPIFGLPLTEAITTTRGDGEPVLRQTFERGILEQNPAGQIRLLPLGRRLWAENNARTPQTRVRAR